MNIEDFQKNEKICVVGLGYVGLPLAVLFNEKYNVIGFDINPKRIEELKQGYDRTREVEPEKLKNCSIEFTTNPEKISEAKVIIITVPTPIDEHNIPDLRPVKSATKTVGKYMQKGSIIVYESTVYPGLTEEECVPILEQESGLKWKVDFNVGYSPERVNPGDKLHTIDKIIKVVAGDTPEITEFLSKLYGSVITAGIHKAPNIKTAEAAKVIENTQRDLNIALMNELSIIFNKMGIDTKEVLEAASTKWNFLRFEPGLVGGHCQTGNEYIFVKHGNKIKTYSFEELNKNIHSKDINYMGTTFRFPKEEINLLSFDPFTESFTFQKANVFTKRRYSKFIKIKTSTGDELTFSDKHPMIVKENEQYNIKLANQLKIGDKIPVISKLPTIYKDIEINLIDILKDEKDIKIKLKNGSWKDYKQFINKKYLGVKVSNYLYWDYLPIDKYLLIRDKLNLDEKQLYIATGKGNSFSKIPAVIKIDEDFARLIGYYLSEGCITKDKSYKIRFTINKEEKELEQDLKNILEKFEIKYSVYDDKKFKARTIKISNKPLVKLFEYLELGKNSYDANIPDTIMFNQDNIRLEVLKGIFRGDAGFSYPRKISYYSASEKLFQQVVLLLKHFDIMPFIQKRKGLLEINAVRDLLKCKDFFLDEKKKKIENAIKRTKRYYDSRNYEKSDGLIIVKVKEIEYFEKEQEIYSVEVDKIHNYVTTNGIITHNCIGVDPYYLTFKAQSIGYHPEVILAGRRVNDYMGKYVAENTVKKLIKAEKAVKGSKVLILGLTFKENISDIRNTKVIDIYNELKEYGINVYIHDPFAYPEEVKEEYGVELLQNIEEKAPYDAIIVAVKHKPFIEEIDFKKYKELMGNNPVLIDVKGLYNKEKAIKEGFLYWRL
ncbi:hypothetical protein JCM14244_11350 [Venenivibrio stagnispumantis]|uniref:Nucleotide sugar dehydrogenase n=2 Tax=Venenivibrio stagnispumantis TaxID=407998 RepID=A0AA45WND2_9AQUI|nr:nucleotide sugar dehydrogenase [Venenivibrio stagnispumantis]MCW4573198.1 nucleotide sugar dehydrogenase [Venenivibrio stagnispumantis]SMP17467.1 nucleotide sugar dehydrogenase [Venenivibrio stagnispumantis]